MNPKRDALKVGFDYSEYEAAHHGQPRAGVRQVWRFALRTDPTWPEDVMTEEGTIGEALTRIIVSLNRQRDTKAPPYSLYYSGIADWCYVWLLP